MKIHASGLAPETLDQYDRIARRLRKQAALHQDQDGSPDATPGELVSWMIAKKTEWSLATWRLYKAAVSHDLAKGDNPASQTALVRLEAEPQTGARKRSGRTSAIKQKSLPPEDLETLADHLRAAHPTETGRTLVHFLVVGIATGLRPGEWRHAICVPCHPDTGLPALIVRNAKHSRGRGNGSARTLHLGDLDPWLQRRIQSVAEMAAEAEAAGGFDTWMAALRKALYRATREIWPNRARHIALYSARHQCAANLKQVFGRPAVAALLGHASAETAGSHYARRYQGRDSLFPVKSDPETEIVPSPAPAEVATVRKARPSPSQNQEATPLIDSNSIAMIDE
jgi:integrase